MLHLGEHGQVVAVGQDVPGVLEGGQQLERLVELEADGDRRLALVIGHPPSVPDGCVTGAWTPPLHPVRAAAPAGLAKGRIRRHT